MPAFKATIVSIASFSIYVCCILLNPVALASEGEGAAAEKDGPGPTVVEVPVVVVPISADDGRLLYYAYLRVQLEIPNPNNRWSVEEKIPQIKDSFVREVHARTNRKPDDPDAVDVEGLRQRLSLRVKDIVRPNAVGSLIIKDFTVPGGQGINQASR